MWAYSIRRGLLGTFTKRSKHSLERAFNGSIMEFGLEGKVAVITGGASGIGRETAMYLAREGARIVIGDLSSQDIDGAVSDVKALGAEAEGVVCDVTLYEDCERLATAATQRFGRIDVLVASAGVGGENTFFVESRPVDWDRCIDVNLRGVLNTNHAIAPVMVKHKDGAIINLASEAGKVGEKRIAVYAASKGAVISFTKAFALEMGRFNVRVNAICPGVTRTPMTERFGEPGSERYEAAAKLYPMGRLGEPEDIASMITFLASDQATWITGQAISVNGGFGRS